MLNKILLVASVVVMGMLGGCAASPAKIMSGSIDNAHKLAKDGSGIVYGAWFNPDTFAVSSSGITVKSACDYVHNNDERCQHQDDYVVGDVIPRSGNFDGLAQILAFMPKRMNVNFSVFPKIGWNTSDYVFVKVKTKKDGIAEVIEVASVPGDGKCNWSGLPLVGRTVCPAYNWDGDINIRSYDTKYMVMTVSDK